MDLLMNMIALLFSLADAAEAAAGRSRRVRCEVLSVMPRAELAAQVALIQWMHHFGAPLMPQAIYALILAAPDVDDPEDALHIADRLRSLALALSYVAAWADYFARRLCAVAHTTQAGLPLSPPLLAGCDIPALPPFDTS